MEISLSLEPTAVDVTVKSNFDNKHPKSQSSPGCGPDSSYKVHPANRHLLVSGSPDCITGILALNNDRWVHEVSDTVSCPADSMPSSSNRVWLHNVVAQAEPVAATSMSGHGLRKKDRESMRCRLVCSKLRGGTLDGWNAAGMSHTSAASGR